MKFHQLARKLSAAALALVLCLSLLPGTARAADSVKFAVMSTSDVHGKVWEQNILNDTAVTQNLLRVSTAVTQARETYGEENVIVVDNGDLYQGTPISSYNINLYTQGLTEDMNPMAVALAHIGYDAAILGNHEFNYAWSTMSDIYAYLAENGVATVCCNLYYEKDDDAGHKAGERVFPAYLIKEIEVGGDIFRIGLIGVENTDCPRWDVSDNYPNMIFAAPDNPTLDLAVEVNSAIADMKADLAEEDKTCDFIIVSYHGALNGDESGLVKYQNTENQVSRIIAGTTDVDMVISGHDHSTAYSNTTYPNMDASKDVLVVNAGGTELTNAVFEVTNNGGKFSVSVEVSENLTLSDYDYDPELYGIIEPYVDLATEFVNSGVGALADGWDAGFEYSNNNCYIVQTDTIDLINRAQIAMGTRYVNEKYASVDELNAKLREIYGEDTNKQYHGDTIQVDMSSTSIVTTSIPSGGDLSMKDIYGFYRYDNDLYLITLTGQEILDLLEYNAATRLQARVSNGAVTFSTKGDYNDAFTNPVFYGLNFTYDMAQPEGSRVQIEGFSNGKDFDVNETYIFAINNYHMGNASSSELAKYSDKVDPIWSQKNDQGGGYVADLVADYVKEKTEADGMVYTTAEAAKNGEEPSHWAMVYTGDTSGVSVADNTAAIGQAVSELADGDQIMIYNASSFGTVGSDLSAVDSEIVDDMLYTSAEAAVMTVGVSDKGITLQGEGGYLAVTDTSYLCFTEELADGCYWEVNESEAAPGKFLVVNKSNGKALEYYSNFTTYALKDQDIYWMEFFRVTDAAGLADSVAGGDRIVFFYPAGDLLVGGTASGDKVSEVEAKAVDTRSGGSVLAVPAESGVFTVETTEDGYYRFKTEDGYLTSGESGNSMTIGEADGDLSAWELTETKGGFLARNVGANFNGNYNQYLEYYSGFTTYGLKDGGDQTAYTFRIYKVGAESVIPEKAEEPEETPTEPETPVEVSFSDVTEANWHYEFVMKMAGTGIVNGYADGTFLPNNSVKWGEALAMVMRWAEYEEQAPVEGGTWASGWIAKAQEDGLVEGDVEQNAVITRAELCELIAKAKGVAPSENESSFEDTDNGYVQALVERGVIDGMPDGSFQPDGELTRAQLCKVLAVFPEK